MTSPESVAKLMRGESCPLVRFMVEMCAPPQSNGKCGVPSLPRSLSHEFAWRGSGVIFANSPATSGAYQTSFYLLGRPDMDGCWVCNRFSRAKQEPKIYKHLSASE